MSANDNVEEKVHKQGKSWTVVSFHDTYEEAQLKSKKKRAKKKKAS